ncbi:MAG: hypothetical protein IK118_09495 [Clostridia bacterium]|nr:hypothetical protein [Clostridia bacterium]MBR5428569.1 hypothetical protein [Clostridia bacterium]
MKSTAKVCAALCAAVLLCTILFSGCTGSGDPAKTDIVPASVSETAPPESSLAESSLSESTPQETTAREPETTDTVDIHTAYETYLEEKLIPEYGRCDDTETERCPQGIVSVSYLDPDGDGTEEMVVAYTEKEAEDTFFRVACYGFENGEVVRLGTVTPCSELYYYNRFGNKHALPFEECQYDIALSSVRQGEQTLIIYECVSLYDDHEYECCVLGLEDRGFTELANIFRPSIGSDGTETAVSIKLPAEMDIESPDVDFSVDGAGEYFKEDFQGHGETVLYYHGGADSEYVYNARYASVREAVSGFFACFGVGKPEYCSIDRSDWRCSLVLPDAQSRLFELRHEFSYSEPAQKFILFRA